MWELIRANKRNSLLLIIAMGLVLMILGYVMGELLGRGAGPFGLALALFYWIIQALVSYFAGDHILLTMSGARKITPDTHRTLFNVVEEMKIAATLPRMPAIYIIDDPAPNAFATGRKPDVSAIAVTSGLLEMLNRDELQGVIGHEIGHVKNCDILYMLLVGSMMGAILMISDLGLRGISGGGSRSRTSSRDDDDAGGILVVIFAVIFMIVAPIIAQLLYYAISKKREYLADASSAVFTRYPEGLASALEKISGVPLKLHGVSKATAPMYIVNPLAVTADGLADITSTHPPISKRIHILRSMAGGAGLKNYDEAFKSVTGKGSGIIPNSALGDAQAVPLAPPATPDDSTRLDRVRETTDSLWVLNRYTFIPCACGTTLKIPPGFTEQSITCPHCQAVHSVKEGASDIQTKDHSNV